MKSLRIARAVSKKNIIISVLVVGMDLLVNFFILIIKGLKILN